MHFSARVCRSFFFLLPFPSSDFSKFVLFFPSKFFFPSSSLKHRIGIVLRFRAWNRMYSGHHAGASAVSSKSTEARSFKREQKRHLLRGSRMRTCRSFVPCVTANVSKMAASADVRRHVSALQPPPRHRVSLCLGVNFFALPITPLVSIFLWFLFSSCSSSNAKPAETLLSFQVADPSMFRVSSLVLWMYSPGLD